MFCLEECIITHISEIVLHFTPFFKVKSGAGEALRQELRGSLARCGAVGEAVVADALDCTWLHLQRRAIREVERGLALLERHGTASKKTKTMKDNVFLYVFIILHDKIYKYSNRII